MKVTTASGACYQFTKNGMKFRRLVKINPLDPQGEVARLKKDDDGKWLPLHTPAEPVIGHPMSLVLTADEGASLTVRYTSVVVGVEE